MAYAVNGVQALSVLYDLALTIGSEVTVDALLTKTLQRFLYHTGFPAGIVCADLPEAAEAGRCDVRLAAAVGNYALIKRVGEVMRLPAALVAAEPLLAEAPELLAGFPARKAYRHFLRLPVPDFGAVLLLSPDAPQSPLPLTDLFLPIMSRLATAITLCRRIRDRTAALEQANSELEAFAYSVSHDLRAPLRAIDGYSHILVDDYGTMLDDEGRRLLGQVRSNASRMERLIDDILSFSRMSRREMEAMQVDMEELVREVVAELQAASPQRRLRFEIGALPAVRGDRDMLRQVLVNLLANAVKFTRVREEAVIEVGGSSTAEGCVFQVKDNGVGFDMAYVNKLFGVFERLHGQKEYEGTGIGLAIVKRIVARHGGRVWAEGKEGEGAVFHFFLPRG
ncbi:MAG: sensor histidine kinase [Ignavibacteria bacterium]